MSKEFAPTNAWGKFWIFMCILSLFGGPVGWVMAFVFFVAFGATVKEIGEDEKPEPYTGYRPPEQRNAAPVKHGFSVGKVTAPVKMDTLRLTAHAKRTLALRHGVISPYSTLEFEQLKPFEEEGEDIYITKFPQLNKSKEFAVALDPEKKVILTVYPHTDYNRNRAYFKKHTNLDTSLKDDLTKDLKQLQDIWISKLSG